MALNSFMNDDCGYVVSAGEFIKGIEKVDQGRFVFEFECCITRVIQHTGNFTHKLERCELTAQALFYRLK
jgi:hypothetical protein